MPPILLRIAAILRPIIVIGILILLLILIIGGIARLAEKGMPEGGIRGIFSAIFLSREQIVVTASPASVESGGSVSLSWTHEKKTREGMYELSYPCWPSFKLQKDDKDIACNSAYLVEGASILVTPVSENTGSIDIPVTITFTDNGATRPSLSASTVITVMPKEIEKDETKTPTPKPDVETPDGAVTPKPGEKKTTVYPIQGSGGSRAFDPNGYPDLAIEILDTGILLGDTFVKSSSVGQGQRAAVIFSVKNIGTNITPDWKFKANLPTANGEFTSETQTPIYPGDRIEFTIGFDNPNNQGANTVNLVVDPEGRIFKDPNRVNNYASVTIQRNY